MKTIETISNAPFRHLISTIGELPTSFTESMSYYEMLAWLCDFIEKKVVPVVDANAEALIELQEYVVHYFDNLDVQEEINNKLDDMAESGQLADIIAAYLEIRSILAYNRVSEMKLSDNLSDGSFAETYGFYANGDGGGAKYKVRQITNVDTVDEITLIALNDPDLVAELVTDGCINTKQFGVKGDGVTDDTANMKAFFGYDANKYIVNAANILIDDDLDVTSNSTIEFLDGCKIIRKATSDSTYFMLNLVNKENIIIDNAYLIGDRDTHSGETGEWGCGINCAASKNVTIRNALIEKTWGDGIYVGLSYHAENIAEPKNILIDGCTINNCSRNGIAICCGEDIIVSNCTITGTNRTNPKAGIDIEPEAPDGETPYLKNVLINNINTNSNDLGITISTGTYVCENLTISGHNSYEDDYALVVFSFDGNSTAVYENALITKSRDSAIQISKKKSSTFVVRNIVADTSRKSNVTHAYDGVVVIVGKTNDDGGIILDNIDVRKSFADLYEWQDLVCVRGTGTVQDLTLRNINTTKSVYLSNVDVDTIKYENCNIVFNSSYYDVSLGLNRETCANRIYATNEIVTNTSRTIYGIPDGEYILDTGKNTGYTFSVTFDSSYLLIYNNNSSSSNHTMSSTSSGASMRFRKKGSIIIVEFATGFTIS